MGKTRKNRVEPVDGSRRPRGEPPKVAPPRWDWVESPDFPDREVEREPEWWEYGDFLDEESPRGR